MELGAHLPLIELGDEGQSLERLQRTVDAARQSGFAAVSANDHLLFAAPWLDGLTALAAIAERAGGMALATTVALPVIRGPVSLAKSLAALDILCDGTLEAGVGPGSSPRDYDVAGVPFEERWSRFEESAAVLRTLLRGEPSPTEPRYYDVAEVVFAPAPRRPGGIPIWIGSWGSRPGLRRVARLADGWLASAYNTTPERFGEARTALEGELQAAGRSDPLPSDLATMWTWVTDSRAGAERMLSTVLGPLLGREPEELRRQVCVGPPEHCAELLSRYAAAGCRRVYLWPLGDEPRQIARAATEVAPLIEL